MPSIAWRRKDRANGWWEKSAIAPLGGGASRLADSPPRSRQGAQSNTTVTFTTLNNLTSLNQDLTGGQVRQRCQTSQEYAAQIEKAGDFTMLGSLSRDADQAGRDFALNSRLDLEEAVNTPSLT